jgi:transposase-like protein
MAKHDANGMRALLARKDRRGLTYEELSEETGIPVSTLGYWRRRLREERGSVFEEVVIEDEARAESMEVIGPLGHRVVVSSDFDPALLRRILEALPC